MNKVSEHSIQVSAFEEIRFRANKDPAWGAIFSVPNQGVGRNKRLQLEGAKVGVWDILIAVPRGPHPFGWIEVKTKEGRLSDSQEAFGMLMLAQGAKMYLCRSSQAIVRACEEYLSLRS